MKKGVEAFYEGLSRKKAKRRRMVSLLLVLSMFVTSGVSWSLHGVGLTMANEAECGIEEHIHGEECYEKQLVCGLEEDEGHEHSEECYEDVLVCGKDEHRHETVCYTGEEPEAYEEDEDFDDSDYAVMDGVIVSNVEKLSEKGEEAVSTAPAEDDESETGTAVSTVTTTAGTGDTGTGTTGTGETDTGTGTETTETGATGTDTTTATAEEEELLKAKRLEALRLLAEGDSSELPPTIQTVDNIAEGIKFTLFDYDGCDVASNHYGYSQDGPPYTHNNISYEGINTDRNPKDDILFFAYGTPVPKDADGAVVEGGERVYNYTVTDGDTKTQYYHPDKNSYAGDYNSDPQYSGNRAVQGIVGKELYYNSENPNDPKNGYPVIADSGHSLNYLFAPNTNVEDVDQSAYKTVYDGVNHEGVNHLLKRVTSENGVDHLVYNSDVNYAYFNKDTNEFEVYNDTFDIVNKNHHTAEDIDLTTNEAYGEPKDPGFKIGFFPFNEYDPTRKDPNFDVNSEDYRYNHHFGMTMEASFTNKAFDRANVKEPITFKYSGDDDMWVFVDNKLVLDLGGIHEPAGGMIDFSHGLVWTQDNGATGEGKSLADVKTQLTVDTDSADSLYTYVSQHAPELINGYSYTDEHGQTKTKTAEEAWNELPKPIGVNTSQGSGDKWIVKPITDYIEDWYTSGDANGNHKINMFYLERGGCYSNLAMEMNLPTLKPLTVTKDVDYQHNYVKGLYEKNTYVFQIYERVKDPETGEYDEWFIPNDALGQPIEIADGERWKMDDLAQDRCFKVVEVGVKIGGKDPIIPMDSTFFSKVSVNGTDAAINGGRVDTAGGELQNLNSYDFTNQIREETTSIIVKKEWDPPNKKIDGFKVKFKIIRTDTSLPENDPNRVKQVALRMPETDSEGQTKIVKKRTFSFSTTDYPNGYELGGLLSQFGNHFYAYEVEELNVPDGYKAKYSSDGNTRTITNTDITKADIFVKKQWENVTGNQPKVKLVLKRERVGYSGSVPTDLTIRLVDERGNLIRSCSTQSASQYDQNNPDAYEGVFVGGSAEFSCILPEGAELYKPSWSTDPNPIHSPESIYVNEELDEEIITVQNLAAGSNVVTLKIKTDNVEDSVLLLHHSFTYNTDGWVAQGDNVEILTSNAESYAKGDALLVRNRTAAWNGVKLYLDPAVFKPNKDYTFSVYVYSPESTTFKMTFNNGLNSYEPITEPPVSYDAQVDGWKQLTGHISLTNTIDPYNMFILIETTSFDSSVFRIDEFTAIEGSTPVTISPQQGSGDSYDPGGVVTIGEATSSITYTAQNVYNYNTMQNYGDEGWYTFGNPTLSSKELDWGANAVVVTDRHNDYDGVQKNVNLSKGKTYHITSQVSGHDDGNGSHRIEFWLKYYNPNKSGEDKYDYTPIGGVDTTGNTWGTIDTDFTVPSEADDTQTMMVYYRTGANQTGTSSEFEVWSSRLYEKVETQSQSQGFTEPKDGYYINENGQYVSNYSNYHLDVNKDSLTNPLKLDGEYTLDRVNNSDPNSAPRTWEITLPDNSNVPGEPLMYHWDKAALDEENNYLYRYWIEEELIGSEDVVTTHIETVGEERVVVSTDMDQDYIISYDKQFVATNDAANPILVTNKYIWYKLPATGGIGVDLIYVVGILLTITGLTGVIALKKRERRSG
ncbi:MAG: fibro-slime domain-containing protein [Ruminococcus sp.]|nr:fibro-slime domain-containing protein [Ruminococcus sp.]